MAGQEKKWHLADVVDFEVLLRESGDREELRQRRRELEMALAGTRKLDEATRRRVGLRVWLETVREASEGEAGQRVTGALRLAAVVLGVVGFLAGIGVMRGLLVRVEVVGRAYNVWIFLGVALALQWLILIVGVLWYALVRRATGALSVLQSGALWVTRRLAGVSEPAVWNELLATSAGYRSVFSWRVARLTQGVAMAFNLGLMAGFLGCLWVLKVGFYWESTLAVSGMGLLEFMQALAWPWEWAGMAPAPTADDIEFALLPKFFFERVGSTVMWPFLMMCLAVYGLLPRLALWMLCLAAERRALARIDFQAPRHRELWRHLTKVERSLPTTGPADGVVLLDVGGIEAPPELLREFLLRSLRVNPQAHYTAAVLDEEREREALDAIRGSDLGVVVLVEGWALSPKQMTALHRRIRSLGGARMPVHFLVIGELKGGQLAAAGDGEWQQWKSFVDSLRDPATDAIAYRELPSAS